MPNGAHRRSFDVGDCRVIVEPGDRDSDEAGAVLAEALSGDAERWEDLRTRYMSAVGDRALASEEITRLRGRIAPNEPARLLGPGYVRFSETRIMWLLSRRDTGWSSFGVVVSDWDDLFRRYNALVTAHGEDEHGPWWEVASPSTPNTPPARAARGG